MSECTSSRYHRYVVRVCLATLVNKPVVHKSRGSTVASGTFVYTLPFILLLLLCEPDRQHEAEAALHAVRPYHGAGEDMSTHTAPKRKRAADGLSLYTRGRYPAPHTPSYCIHTQAAAKVGGGWE